MTIRFEDVGIAVRDLEATVAFFTDLGLEVAGRDEVGMHRVACSVDDLDATLAVAACHGVHPLRGVPYYQG